MRSRGVGGGQRQRQAPADGTAGAAGGRGVGPADSVGGTPRLRRPGVSDRRSPAGWRGGGEGGAATVPYSDQRRAPEASGKLICGRRIVTDCTAKQSGLAPDTSGSFLYLEVLVDSRGIQ